MHKIASPQQLQVELRRLLAYVESPQPSRGRIASMLNQLAAAVGHKEAEAVPPAILRLVQHNKTLVKKPSQVEVSFDSEAKANSFEDRAKATLGLDDTTLDDWDLQDSRYEVSGKMDPKTKTYTVTISF